MKRLIFTLSLIVFLLASCNKKNEYTITGHVVGDSLNGTKVYLQQKDSIWKNSVSIDSTTITDGKFTFKGITPEVMSLRIISLEKPIGKYRGNVVVILENGKIDISLDSVSTIKGDPINSEYQSLKDKLTKTQEEIERIDSQLDTVTVQGKMADLVKQNKAKSDEMKNEFYNFTKKNISNDLGEYLLVSNSSIFDVDQLKELIAAVGNKAKNAEIIQKQAESLPAREATKVGATYVDIKSKTPDGKDIAISDFIGKNDYVLIDFWASWCPPCRKDAPNLVAVYNKYKDKGFTIIGVSIDNDKDAWIKGISSLNLEWPHMSDLTRPSALSKAYGVVYIPHTILLDKEGKIIARGLHGKEIMVMLDALIK